MPKTRPSATNPLTAIAGLALLALAGCSSGDIGSPCNHGSVEPPESKLVTFPALACNDLLCVYADEKEPPGRDCTSDADCNEADPEITRFQCVADSNTCQLSMEYVLGRSMCSKKCSSDSDCKDGGPGNKVVDENTTCEGGFRCARIQSLGEFCCQKMCVCADDLSTGSEEELNEACDNSTAKPCCVEDVLDEVAGTVSQVLTNHEGCGGN